MKPQREHRRLAAYLSLHAWQRGLDCVAVDRDSICGFLEIDKLKGVRVNQIIEDTRHLFPHSSRLWFGPDGYLILFSRVPMSGIPGSLIYGETREWKGHSIARVRPPSLESIEECLMRLALGHPVHTVFQVVDKATGKVQKLCASKEMAEQLASYSESSVVRVAGLQAGDGRPRIPTWSGLTRDTWH